MLVASSPTISSSNNQKWLQEFARQPWEAKLPQCEKQCTPHVCSVRCLVSRRLAVKTFCFTHFVGWNLEEDVIYDLMKAAFVIYWPASLINQCTAQWLMIICIFETYPETTKTSSTLCEKKGREWKIAFQLQQWLDLPLQPTNWPISLFIIIHDTGKYCVEVKNGRFLPRK